MHAMAGQYLSRGHEPVLVVPGRRDGVAIVDGFSRHLCLPGLGWRPFSPTILLPVTLMTPETRGMVSRAMLERMGRLADAALAGPPPPPDAPLEPLHVLHREIQR
jgi:hypothetical protein